MKNLIRILCYLFFYSILSYSQPAIEWIKNIGTQNFETGGYSIQKTPDGGYVIIGRQIQDPFIAKTNSNGDILWARSFNIPSDLNGKLDLCQSSAGDIYYSNGLNGIIKINGNGDSLWYKTFNVNNLHSLIYTSDNSIVACGDDGILKLDLTGNLIWEKIYNSPKLEILQSIYETNDNGFISVGSIDSMDMADILILRYNSDGDTLWTKVISSLFTIESAQDVLQNDDGTFTICGASDQFTGNNNYDILLLKIDADGSIIWLKNYGGIGSEWSFELKKTFDDGYILAGRKDSDNYEDIYILRTDLNGDTLWTTSVGGAGDDWGWSVFYNDDNSFVVGGESWSFTSNYDLLIIKYYPEISSINNQDISIGRFRLLQNYPNPFNPNTIIEYSVSQTSQVQINIFDIIGNEIATLVNDEKQIGTYKLTWYPEGLPSGVYFYQLKAGDFIETKKMVLFK